MCSNRLCHQFVYDGSLKGGGAKKKCGPDTLERAVLDHVAGERGGNPLLVKYLIDVGVGKEIAHVQTQTNTYTCVLDKY